MTDRKESKLVTVKIIGIEGARRATERNGGSPIDPWYKNHTGETYEVIERKNDYILLATGGSGMPAGHSCAGNRTICKEDVEVLD